MLKQKNASDNRKQTIFNKLIAQNNIMFIVWQTYI